MVFLYNALFEQPHKEHRDAVTAWLAADGRPNCQVHSTVPIPNFQWKDGFTPRALTEPYEQVFTPAYIHLGRPLDVDQPPWTKSPRKQPSRKSAAALSGPFSPPPKTPPGLLESRRREVPMLPQPPAPVDGPVTTLVVRNLSGRYSQEDVMRIWPIDGSYNFMHVPYNLLQKRPLGYLFINLCSPELAAAFIEEWHGKSLANGASKKALEVAPADVQGFRANLELLKSRKMGQLEKAGFLPLVLKGKTVLGSKAILAELHAFRGAPTKNAAKAARISSRQACQPSVRCADDLEGESTAGTDSDAQTSSTAASLN